MASEIWSHPRCTSSPDCKTTIIFLLTYMYFNELRKNRTAHGHAKGATMYSFFLSSISVIIMLHHKNCTSFQPICDYEKLRYLFKNNKMLIYHGASVHISSHYSMLLTENITSVSALIKFLL